MGAASSSPAAGLGSPAAKRASPAKVRVESAAALAARAMQIVGSGSPASSRTAATPTKAASPAAAQASPERWAVMQKPAATRLKVMYTAPHAGAPSPVLAGLVALRRGGRFCDTAVVSGASRMPCHRAVLAAGSEVLARHFDGSGGDVELRDVTGEAADYLVRFLYAEVSSDNFFPSTHQVNAEILKLAFDFQLPRLAELCGVRMGSDVDTGNVVARIGLCEACGLPDLRAAMLQGIMDNPQALSEVARDPTTFQHPGLMRELLMAIAQGCAASAADAQSPAKRARTQ